MIDLLLRGARLADGAGGPTGTAGSAWNEVEGLVDLAVDGGRLVAVRPSTAGQRDAAGHPSDAPEAAREVVDLGGRLVTTPLVEPHIHLDAVLTEGQPRSNASGSLFEGISIWAERVRELTTQDVTDRVRQVLRWQVAHGVLHVRTHVDVCDPALTALRALVALREEVAGVVDLQIVAFPQQGVLSFGKGDRQGGGTGDSRDGRDLLREAVELGADVVGGIPHYEMTREDGVESVRFAMALADQHGLKVDIHCDEIDDEHSRYVEVVAEQTLARGMAGRVTASHLTAMHSYPGAYAYLLVRRLARAGVHVVTNPLDNATLQGRFDVGPIRRGHTRVKELQAAGVTVAIGHDSVQDPWYPLGIADPMQGAFVLAHLGHMTGADELRRLVAMVTTDAATVLGLPPARLAAGEPADLVVHDATSESEAVRLQRPRYLVVRAGQVVARTDPARTSVRFGPAGAAFEPVSFTAR